MVTKLWSNIQFVLIIIGAPIDPLIFKVVIEQVKVVENQDTPW